MIPLTYWLFQPEAWLILALVLIVADIMIGMDYFVLPVGIAAALIAVILFAENRFWFSNTVLLDSWRDILITFAVLSVAAVFLVRKLFQRRRGDIADINDY